VLEDLYGGLEDQKKFYSFLHYPCPFNDPYAIKNKLEQLDKKKFDAIALIRGGGNHLDKLNSRIVLKACAGLSTPLLVAAGHFVDKPFIQHIASKVCGTPTMLGVYLANLEREKYSLNPERRQKSKPKPEKIFSKKIKSFKKFWKKMTNTLSFIMKCTAYIIHICFALSVLAAYGKNTEWVFGLVFLWLAYTFSFSQLMIGSKKNITTQNDEISIDELDTDELEFAIKSYRSRLAERNAGFGIDLRTGDFVAGGVIYDGICFDTPGLDIDLDQIT
jgi:hypothetical protein